MLKIVFCDNIFALEGRIMKVKEMITFTEHMDKYFHQECEKVIDGVFENNKLHIDILIYEPNNDFPFWKLVTMGFSDYKMPHFKSSLPNRNEYMIFFNKDVDVSTTSKELGFYIDALMNTAMASYELKEPVSYAHDIKFEMPDSEMVATIVMMPEVVPDVGILRCKLGAFKKCACLQVMPITQIEYELVYEKSGFWLIDNRFYNNEDMSKCHYLAEKYRTF